ncbi:unnamed protein product [Caenorhabditis auriculariae]|uniref:Uncharacterized protein n=1 Tax=Caenorhabditis auriculariae TaxID=2777116 RepID=A0A8S1H859_9PELO|nr:unnamed protein product [Caenorhabditis auriculariae]
MNKLRSAFKWKRKSYDSDSTGYCSSSDVSRPLSDSQFILRPSTVMSNSYSLANSYYNLEYAEFKSTSLPMKTDTVSSRTSRKSTVSSQAYNGDHSSMGEDDEDDVSTLRPTSSQTQTVPLMPQLTSIKHFMAQEELRRAIPRTTPELDEMPTISLATTTPGEDDDIDCDISASTSVSTAAMPDYSEDETVDVVSKSPSYTIRFPFDEFEEEDMAELFDQLEFDDQQPSTSSANFRQKKLLIKEPSSKIYYDEEENSEAQPPLMNRPESAPRPRSILKKGPSFAGHIYEEIEGDHLTPIPEDIRPELPVRPFLQPLRFFPPCNFFQPRQRYPSIRRRKKMPSLHHSQSLASYFSKKRK